VGTRAARQLVSSPEVGEVVLVDRHARRAEDVARALGPNAAHHAWQLDALEGAAAVLVAAPLTGAKVRARPSPVDHAVRAGAAVVSASDRLADVEALLGLDRQARASGATVVVGAGMAPGLTDVLARWAATELGTVEEVHVAKAGTGGPACARQHHRALGEEALDWRDGQWARRAGGSGRELVWFPGPVGGQDCYRAGLPDALLLVPAFPGVRRVTARLAATRRDRLTAALPMLRPPHPEGEVGAVRVELRGRLAGGRHAVVLGSAGRPAAAAAAVAAASVLWALRGGLYRARAAGLAELLVDAGPFLAELTRRGVTVEAFEGGSARARA
jgi:saccharopine dehydrogenase-like NADP-dependent oxidoreductase